jgi:DNA (cytosine-5)-methyltransferase 1
MRGRNPDNPSGRTAGIETVQRLEPRADGITNTITTVQKDNLLLYNPYNKAEIKNIAPTQTASCGSTTSSAAVISFDGGRVRKLTPTECWRLIGWKDEQINKVKAAKISNCQMYRQAGNGIVVNVLEAIFKNLFDTR